MGGFRLNIALRPVDHSSRESHWMSTNEIQKTGKWEDLGRADH